MTLQFHAVEDFCEMRDVKKGILSKQLGLRQTKILLECQRHTFGSLAITCDHQNTFLETKLLIQPRRKSGFELLFARAIGFAGDITSMVAVLWRL